MAARVHPDSIEMASTLLVLNTSVVHVKVSQGTVGATISTADSESGNALMLVITNPHGPKVEIVACFGERVPGRNGCAKERFPIPLHGIPYTFGEDGERCVAWAEARSLTSLEDVIQLYVRDTNGNEWPLENAEHLLDIRKRLTRLTRPAGHPSQWTLRLPSWLPLIAAKQVKS